VFELKVKRLALVLGALCVLLAVPTASARVDGPAATHAQKLTTVNVMDVAGIPYIYLQLGVYEGFFKRNGLDVKAQAAAGGAVIVPAVVNGSVQFGGSNVVSTTLAVSRGLPIRMIAPGTFGGTKTPDWAAIVVKKDSPIRSVKDLAGKTIGANTLRNVVELTSKGTLDKAGGDPSSLKFLEVDFPQQQDALDAGRIDAAFLIEPFLYDALKAGDRVIAYAYYETRPGLQIGSYLTSADYQAKNPQIVTAFQRSLQQLSWWIQHNPKAVRKFMTAAGGPAQDVAQHMQLPHWKVNVDLGSLTQTGQLMVKYGMVAAAPDPKSFVIESPKFKPPVQKKKHKK
jgi:NitT/TauT family transport system substrate-binding protein